MKKTIQLLLVAFVFATTTLSAQHKPAKPPRTTKTHKAPPTRARSNAVDNTPHTPPPPPVRTPRPPAPKTPTTDAQIRANEKSHLDKANGESPNTGTPANGNGLNGVKESKADRVLGTNAPNSHDGKDQQAVDFKKATVPSAKLNQLDKDAAKATKTGDKLAKKENDKNAAKEKQKSAQIDQQLKDTRNPSTSIPANTPAKAKKVLGEKTQGDKAREFQGPQIRSARPTDGDVKGAKKRDDADEEVEGAKAAGASQPVKVQTPNVEKTQGEKAREFQGPQIRSARPKDSDVKGAQKREEADEAAEAARVKAAGASQPVNVQTPK